MPSVEIEVLGKIEDTDTPTEESFCLGDYVGKDVGTTQRYRIIERTKGWLIPTELDEEPLKLELDDYYHYQDPIYFRMEPYDSQGWAHPRFSADVPLLLAEDGRDWLLTLTPSRDASGGMKGVLEEDTNEFSRAHRATYVNSYRSAEAVGIVRSYVKTMLAMSLRHMNAHDLSAPPLPAEKTWPLYR